MSFRTLNMQKEDFMSNCSMTGTWFLQNQQGYGIHCCGIGKNCAEITLFLSRMIAVKVWPGPGWFLKPNINLQVLIHLCGILQVLVPSGLDFSFAIVKWLHPDMDNYFLWNISNMKIVMDVHFALGKHARVVVDNTTETRWLSGMKNRQKVCF